MPSNSFAGRIHSLKLEDWPSELMSSHGPSSLSWQSKIQTIFVKFWAALTEERDSRLKKQVQIEGCDIDV